MKKFFLKSYNLERKRRLKSKKIFDEKALLEWKKIINYNKFINDKKLFQKYFNFSKNLNYTHKNSYTYFSHPLRVANMAFRLSKYSTAPKNLIILGLFHNILETSNCNMIFLKKYLGKKILDQIKTLTIDRKREWNNKYKKNYYKSINSHHKNTRLIKIIDKLDNLFVIGLNKKKLIRKRYILEIENHIVPMVNKDAPSLIKYFEGLIKQSYRLGYYENEIKQKYEFRN